MRTVRQCLAGTALTMLVLSLGPAVAAEGGTSGVDVDVLSDRGVIPVEAIPPDVDHTWFARVMVEPSSSAEEGSEEPAGYTYVEYVEQGSAQVVKDTRAHLWGEDGSDGAPDPMATIALGAGDVVLYYDGAASGSWVIDGTEPYVSFIVGIANSIEPQTPREPAPGADYQLLVWDFPAEETLTELISAPVAVILERITFDPGGQLVLDSDEAGVLRLLALEEGRLESGFAAPSEVDGALTDSVRFIAPDADILTSGSFAGDTVYVIRNASDEPAVVESATLTDVDGTTEAKPAE